jgi:serine phosphatase RsbU (regulator of sigma subunit)
VAAETEQAKQEAEIQRIKSVELAGALKELRETQAELISGINYARTIQQTILLTDDELQRAFGEDYFLFYRPKDIVSGDFYWQEQLSDATLIAVCDCTGHGVPGAFMSMMSNDLLSQIVVERGIHAPAEILAELHRGIRKALRQEQSNTQDGMDICLLRIEPKQVIFSGAKRPLFIVSFANNRQEKTFVEIKGDRFSIGGFQKEENRTFSSHAIARSGEMIFFLSSDGYADQCNERLKSIGTKRFKEILYENASLPMKEQRKVLQEFLLTHQGAEQQRDDITVFGIRLV